MSDAHGERPMEADDRGVRMLSASFDEYAEARGRYFETLRMDAEVRRLERMWHLPTFGREPGEGSTG